MTDMEIQQLSDDPAVLDGQVSDLFVSRISEFPEVIAVYRKHVRDGDDPGDDEVRLFVVMQKMHLNVHGRIGEIENEIIDALPEGFRYRYEFLRLFQQDGQVETVVSREGLEQIFAR